MQTHTLPTIHSVLEYWAKKEPEAPFVITGEHFCSMGYLDEQYTKLANSLQALGVKKGDMVAVMMAGSIEYLTVWFAISKIGAVEVPINNAYKGFLLEHVIKTTNLQTVVLDFEFSNVMESAFENLGQSCNIISNNGAGGKSLKALIEEGKNNELNTDVLSTDIACVLFTSGTTGPSKGVLMSHGHALVL